MYDDLKRLGQLRNVVGTGAGSSTTRNEATTRMRTPGDSKVEVTCPRLSDQRLSLRKPYDVETIPIPCRPECREARTHEHLPVPSSSVTTESIARSHFYSPDPGVDSTKRESDRVVVPRLKVHSPTPQSVYSNNIVLEPKKVEFQGKLSVASIRGMYKNQHRRRVQEPTKRKPRRTTTPPHRDDTLPDHSAFAELLGENTEIVEAFYGQWCSDLSYRLDLTNQVRQSLRRNQRVILRAPLMLNTMTAGGGRGVAEEDAFRECKLVLQSIHIESMPYSLSELDIHHYRNKETGGAAAELLLEPHPKYGANAMLC